MLSRIVTAAALVLLMAAPASADRRHFRHQPQDDDAFGQMTEPTEREGDPSLHRDFDHRSFDGTVGSQQQPAPMQPYWGTMRPYWNGSEPPGVIHRGARTRGFTKSPRR